MVRFVTENIKDMAKGIITIEASNFFIEEDSDLSTCIRCDDIIFGKQYQAVCMFKSGVHVSFSEHQGLKICSDCHEEVKHRFEP